VYKYVESPATEVAASPGYDSLLDYWHILIRHRMTVLRFAAAGLLGAIVVSLVQTPIYRVRTSLEIQGPNFPEMKGSNDSNGSYASPESYVETQVKILQSESVIEHVIDKLKLQKRAAHNRLARLCVARAAHFRIFQASNLPEREELIRQIKRNLTVRTSGNSRLLRCYMNRRIPSGAADFANTLVSEFVELSQEERWRAAQGHCRMADEPPGQNEGRAGSLGGATPRLRTRFRAVVDL